MDLVTINIPFTVYTAWNGYAWSVVPEDVPLQELNAVYRAIGEYRPDFMGAGDSFEGVYYANGLVTAFRMQCVSKWDSVGRDADYCAFGFMGTDVVGQFDFDVLLAHESFSRPSHAPPDYLVYEGPVSAPFVAKDALTLYDGGSLGGVDFHTVGDMLEKCTPYCGEWFFCRTSFRGGLDVMAKTGKWASEPPAVKVERARKKAKFQRFSLQDMPEIFGGD